MARFIVVHVRDPSVDLDPQQPRMHLCVMGHLGMVRPLLPPTASHFMEKSTLRVCSTATVVSE